MMIHFDHLGIYIMIKYYYITTAMSATRDGDRLTVSDNKKPVIFSFYPGKYTGKLELHFLNVLKHYVLIPQKQHYNMPDLRSECIAEHECNRLSERENW